MKLLFAAGAASAVLFGVLLGSPSAQAEKKIPSPPYYYVQDEPHVLDQKTTRALQTLLIEHDRVTGEQFLIAVFNSLDGEDLVDYTNRVFSNWKIGQRGKDNGVLLALYWQDHKARIEVGYGLEPLLTDAKSKLIITDILVPELQNHDPGRALTLAALEILRTIGSPLVQNGKAEQILRSGGFRGDFAPRSTPVAGSVGFWPWLFLGFILFTIFMNFVHSAEAHFTRSGWYRPRPWEYYRINRRGGGFWGGGFGGGSWGGGGFGGSGGGGFGGFSGGGGSSGGGGASGSW